METKTLITYSLLTHLKETKYSNHSSIAEIFFPIVKKAILEYSNERGNIDVKGRNISEIQTKIMDFFGITIPLGVLDFILSQIKKEINNDEIFAYYGDKSFVINAFVFKEIDEDIRTEKENVHKLIEDFEKYCISLGVTSDFEELVGFICSQKTELFANGVYEDSDVPYYIPKYLNLRYEHPEIFQIISDIYLGSIISSYFTYNIKAPVANTELIIDTNYFISLLDLNTHEAYLTCNQLHELGNRLGYRFSILYSTIDQIKALLSTRIQDFANKEIGAINEADIFGACIRRNLNKSDLERIKDSIGTLLHSNNVSVIHEAQLKTLIEKAKKSDKYKEILDIRKGQKLSALNDTVAFYYVNDKRGNNINEFSDVKCWFLNNSFHSDYFANRGYKLHERYKISANELLSLLWLANPNQADFDIKILSKGGLSTYIAKYKNRSIPSIQTIKEINARSKRALEFGGLNEKDVYSISIRMAEGQLTGSDAEELIQLPDEEFIKFIKDKSKEDQEILSRINDQNDKIEKQSATLEQLIIQNTKYQELIEFERAERAKEGFIQSKLPRIVLQMNSIAWGYIFFAIIISSLWLINHFYLKLIGDFIGGVIAFLLFLSTLFIRFIDHKNVLKCLKFTFLKSQRQVILQDIKMEFEQQYIVQNQQKTEN
jgi:hypothetical protein